MDTIDLVLSCEKCGWAPKGQTGSALKSTCPSCGGTLVPVRMCDVCDLPGATDQHLTNGAWLDVCSGCKAALQ